jgi:hypothetical protein
VRELASQSTLTADVVSSARMSKVPADASPERVTAPNALNSTSTRPVVEQHRSALAISRRQGVPSAPRLLLGIQRQYGNRHVQRVLHCFHAQENARIQRKKDPARTSFPWNGRIANTSSAALRKTPAKAPDDPHRNTIADLYEGTDLQVVGAEGGWLHVQVEVKGQALTGYVSSELVAFVSPSAFDVGEIVIEVKLPTVAEAFVELKRAQMRKVKEGTDFKPTKEEQDRMDRAEIVLNATNKYTVDENTYEVNFVAQTGQTKTQVTTIEDFILFVEQVEKQYPSASAKEVASEIRQVYFRTHDWEFMVDSHGISDAGADVDIRTEPNPIASRFDMNQIRPANGGLILKTKMGDVDIGHVMSGIDARLSGFPASISGHTSPSELPEAMLKHDTLKKASGGDVRDFTTWAGDLGQAYAEYLLNRYVEGNASASLKALAAQKAPPSQMRGDIHGYIAVDVFQHVPLSVSPTGNEQKVSDILRDMYLVDKSSLVSNPSSGVATPQSSFERLSGKSGIALKPFITERSLDFARPWYAKKLIVKRGTGVTNWLDQNGWTKEGIVENTEVEFDTSHAENEKSAAQENKLSTLIDSILPLLSAPMQ